MSRLLIPNGVPHVAALGPTRRSIALLVACLTVLASWPVAGRGAGPEASGARIALVVGNSAYTGELPPLRNPVNDARLMARTLRALDFRVTLVENVGEDDLVDAVHAFGDALRGRGQSGVGLFYYAGHGVQWQGANYLVPVGAKVKSERHLESRTVSAGVPLAEMRNAPTALNIVVLDACQDNPWAASGKRSIGGVRGLTGMDVPTGSTGSFYLAYSAAAGQAAEDGDGDNSRYTRALATAMGTAGLELEDVFKEAGRQVAAATGSRQEPWVEGAWYGQFYFKSPSPPGTAPASSSLPADPLDPATEAWRQIRERGDVETVEDYLRAFPDTPFRQAAELRLAVLRGGTRDPAPSIPLSGEPFTVRTGPGTARVQVMNIEPTYLPGIQLPPGSYDVKVTAPGFDTVERTLRHENEPTDVWIGLPFRDCPVCPKMVEIPTGSYRMGTSEQGKGNSKIEGPVHEVAIRYRLAVGLFEVSFEEWDACRRDGGCQVPLQHEGSGGAYPIDHATMRHAGEYTKWLKDRTGRPYRLPSEGEWEYAARAGTQSERYWGQEDQCAYANGADLVAQLDRPDLGVFASCRDGYTRTAPSDDRRFAPNAWGLYHMLGNVHEWTQDCWFPNYLDAPADGRPREDCEEGGAHRVVRGGSWQSAPRWIRARKRHAVDPSKSYNDLGFRVVVEVSR